MKKMVQYSCLIGIAFLLMIGLSATPVFSESTADGQTPVGVTFVEGDPTETSDSKFSEKQVGRTPSWLPETGEMATIFGLLGFLLVIGIVSTYYYRQKNH
ncbi:hypothetical protein IGJ02_002623 [Enterococcus sp. DIV0724b]|uniref:LPXTG cell wall anchor domain-containing protein n=1 Tax=Enterococcus sp. DIV0724b TaxID=2774694 RepID=UPI003D2FB00C